MTAAHAVGGRHRFAPDEVRQHLEDLVEGLARTGAAVRILLIGGAALSSYYGRDQATSDAEAASRPRGMVLAHAAALAKDKGLRPDWYIEAATVFFPHEAIASHVVTEKGTVRVEVAEPDFLLAMKLRACRPQKDLFDLAFLLRRCDVRAVEEAVGWLERFYPEEVLSERDDSIVKVALGETELPTRPPPHLAPVAPRPGPLACRHWVLGQHGHCVLALGHDGRCPSKKPS